MSPVGTVAAFSYLLLVVYFKRVAQFLNRPELVKSARQVLFVGGACFVLVGAAVSATFLHSTLSVILMLGSIALLLVAFAKYYFLVRRLQWEILRGL